MNPLHHTLHFCPIFNKRIPAATLTRLESMLPANTWIICDTVAKGYRYEIQASWRLDAAAVADRKAITENVAKEFSNI